MKVVVLGGGSTGKQVAGALRRLTALRFSTATVP